MSLFRRSGPRRWFDDGRRALGTGDTDRAVALFERVIAAEPTNTNAWFNLGLAYKLKRDWPNSARANRRAAELDSTNQEAFWNLGVAATVEQDWPAARWAWRNIGVDPGEGDGPPELQLGPSPIRLLTGEVVWAERIDPCRARIANVPLPESGHRHGDVVLHDVVPRGERQAWGKTWGVFDEFYRLHPGEYATLESDVDSPTEEDARKLLDAVTEAGLSAEDWTVSVRWLCETCSLASPHAHAGSDVTAVWLPRRRIGFAGPSEDIAEILDAWAASGSGRGSGPVREATSADGEPIRDEPAV